MKKLTQISACALLAAGVFTSAFGQIEYAGNNQVNLDFTGLPLGPVTDINNTGVAGGVFEAQANGAEGGLVNLGPQVIALGGNGTHGVLFDANSCLQHLTGAGGSALYAPAGIVGTTPNFSVEAWVYEPSIVDDNPVVSWGTRGNCNPNQVACSYGSDPSWGCMPMWCNDHGWGSSGPPPANAWHHLVWTFAAGGTEQIYVDGAPYVSYTGVSPAIDANNNILIGASHANTGGSLSGAVYGGGYIVGRVRIDDGVLTLAQVTNNYAYEVASFTNGTPTFLTAQPLHRWSFTNIAAADASGATITDIGTAHGTASQVNGIIRNNGGTATFTGSALTLSGGSSATAPYVDLTNALISVLSTNNGGSGKVTFEAWVTTQGDGSWTPLFNFGDNTAGKITAPGGNFTGVNYVTLVMTPSGNENQSDFGFQSGNYFFNSFVTGIQTHFAMAWDDIAGTITVYENGMEVANVQTTNRLAGMQDINNWIGRSAWSGDANLYGSIPEFRIFNRILSPQEVLNDYQVGPTVVTSVEKWNGNVSGNWDFNTANWLIGTTAEKYNDGDTVQFDDTLTGTPLVNVTTTVQPGTLTINNTHSNYVFYGNGSISGAVGLTKTGNGTLTIDNLNNYTGVTALNAGTVIVTNLANGSSASPIGAASAAPANISFAGGTLSYQGQATSINRGYAVSSSSTLDVEGNLAISGQISASAGNFTKEGPATLTYNGAVVNQLSGGDYYADNGTVVLDGTAGQTNNISGQIYVGSDQAHSATMILTNTAANLGNWFAIARGNGTGGYTSTANLYNTHMTVANVSLGYANGINGNNQIGNFTLSSNSWLYNNGGTGFNLSESTGSVCTVTINDNSWIYSANRFLIGLQGGAIGNLIIQNNGALTNGGWVSIGVPGNGNVTLKDNAIWQDLGDFNVTDTPGTPALPSVSTLNISNNALLYISTLYVGKSTNCTGTINQSGGLVKNSGGGEWRIGGNNDNSGGGNPNQLGIYNMSGGTLACNDNFQVGAYGTGYFNQTGGSVSVGAWVDSGRFAGGIGNVNVFGGTFTASSPGNIFFLGEAGTGSLTVGGSGVVNCAGSPTGLAFGWDGGSGGGTLNVTNGGAVNVTNNIILGNASSSTDTINLYGGTLAASRIYTVAGSSYVNFYGGTLKAMPGANANFMSGVSQVAIYGGAPYTGAVIDTGANAITIGQDFYDGDGYGNLTKVGTGTLELTAGLYYAGATTVNQGELIIPASGNYVAGSLVLSDGAELDIPIVAPGNQVAPGNVTFGSTLGSTLQFDLGTYGVPTAPPLYTSGTLKKNGTNVINITGSGLTLGDIPLIQYGSLAGSGSFVRGSLPPGVAGYIFTNTANTPNSIDLYVTSVSVLLWLGLDNNNWDFNNLTDYNWSNIVTGASSLYSQGSSVVFDDSALTNVVNLATTNNPSSITFSNNALAYTLQGKGRISGSTGIALDGTGAVTLSTTNNDFSGVTLVTGGSLTAGVPGALSANSPVVVSNATLELNANSQTVNSLIALNALVDGTTATLTGTGFSLENTTVNVDLAGPGSLTAVGTSGEVVTVANNNSYTGKTVVGGGTLYVTNLANGLSASSIGAASASPTNLVLAGGTLSYQGSGANIDRGYTVTANSTLDVAGNLTLNGPLAATGGGIVKTSPGILSYYTATNTDLLSDGSDPGYSVVAGTVVLGGANPTNSVYTNNSEFWVGDTQDSGANLVVSNCTLYSGSWMAIGRGNGTSGYVSTTILTNATINFGGAGFSMGYWNGISGNLATQYCDLYNSSMNLNAPIGAATDFNIAESAGSTATLTLHGNSSINLNQIRGDISLGGNGAMIINDSSSFTQQNNWFDIGNGVGAVGTVEVAGNGKLVVGNGDFNITDVGAGSGYLIITNNGDVEGYGGFYVGKYPGAYGEVDQYGGTNHLHGSGNQEFQIGGNENNAGAATAVYNLYGGAIITEYKWVGIGRTAGAVGTFNMYGGAFYQNITGPGNAFIVAEQGTGTLNMYGGLIQCTDNFVIGGSDGSTVPGTAIVNLNGGTIVAPAVFTGASYSSGTLNFNGGTLKPTYNNAYFLQNVTLVNIQTNGAVIDDGGYTIGIPQVLVGDPAGDGGLIKKGSGRLNLNGVNTYTNTTLVTAGTLGGSGTIAGVVQVNSGAALSAGLGAANATLTLGQSPVLNGTVVANVSTNAGISSADTLNVLAPLTYNGNLNIINVGPNPLQVGETFTLFTAPSISGHFGSITTTAPGQFVTWNVNSPAAGQFTVASVTASSIPHLTNSVSSGNLKLSWPADHTGWRLLVQTNHLASGISGNINDWATVPGSMGINQISIPINSTNRAEFYRLVYP